MKRYNLRADMDGFELLELNGILTALGQHIASGQGERTSPLYAPEWGDIAGYTQSCYGDSPYWCGRTWGRNDWGGRWWGGRSWYDGEWRNRWWYSRDWSRDWGEQHGEDGEVEGEVR